MTTRVLIVGGGPAGATAARFLSENKVETVLVEKDFSRVKPCGGGVPSSAFKELDIPLGTIKKQIRNIKIISPKEETVEISLIDGYIAIVERGAFDSALRGMAATAGAEILNGEFCGISSSDDKITSEITINGEPKKIVSDYIIASDGVNSAVRKALGITPQTAFTTLSIRAGGTDDTRGSAQCEFWFGSGYSERAYAWVFPKEEGFSLGTAALDSKTLKDLLEVFLRRRGLSGLEGTLRGYRVPLWEDGIYNKGRVLFAGDSAGHVMPFTFEGIYYSMKAGQFAADAIIRGKHEEYRKLWRKRFLRRFYLMKMLWNYFLRDDDRMETMVSIFKNTATQRAATGLWLDKQAGNRTLLDFAGIFRKYINWP